MNLLFLSDPAMGHIVRLIAIAKSFDQEEKKYYFCITGEITIWGSHS